MKERDIESTPIQPGLTQQAVDPTLGVGGDIFMPDGPSNGGPERIQSEEPRGENAAPEGGINNDIQKAREELSNLTPLPENAPVELKSAYDEYRSDLLRKADIRLGRANWANRDNNQPVTVTGYLGKGSDGREYVSTEEFSGGTPLDEIQLMQPDAQGGGSGGGGERPPAPPIEPAPEKPEGDKRSEKEAEKIIETAEDYYSAIEKIIEKAPIEQAFEAIQEAGEGYIEFTTAGLPKNLEEKYRDFLRELKKQKDLRPEEVREHFRDILRDVKRERKKSGLEDPLTASTPKVELTGEEEQELERRQKEGLDSEKTHGDSQAIEEATKRLEGAVGKTSKRNQPAAAEQADRQESSSANIQAKVVELFILAQGLKDHPENIYKLRDNADVYGLISMAGLGLHAINSQRQYDSLLMDFDQSNAKSVESTTNNVINFVTDLAGQIQQSLRNDESAPPSWKIDSVQELSKWIAAKQDRELWGRDGIYQLQDAEGKFDQANFLIWLRQQSNLLHGKNPNSEMSPLNSVGITTDYGSEVSIYRMSLQSEAYMRDKKTGRVLHELADQLTYEAFLFGEIRNTDLYWRQNMGDDKKIGEVIMAVHAKNTLTRPKNLQALMTMSARFTEDENNRDTLVGDTFRMGTEVYYNISDKDELLDIFREHPLTMDDFKNAIRIRNNKLDWDEDIGDYEGIYSKGEWSDDAKDLFKENGEVDMGRFVTFLNIYVSPSETVEKVELLRELVRIKAAQKYGEIDPETGKRNLGVGIALTSEELKKREEHYDELIKKYGAEEGKRRFFHERKAERVNVEFGDNLAYGIQRVYGAASKHDLGRAGYDAFTKTNVQEYLAKQGDVGRGGALGMPEQLGLFRDVAPDMISGLRTEKTGRTIYEILKDLRKIDNGISVYAKNLAGEDVEDENKNKIPRTKEDLIGELSFKENAEFYQARNQQVRGMQIFHTLSDAKALDIDKIVTWSALEGLRMDVGEFQEQINEGIIKPFRYADINSNINFAEGVRIFDPHATKRLQEQVDKENVRRMKENIRINKENTIKKENNQPLLPLIPLLPYAVPQYRDGTLLEKTKGKEIVDKVRRDHEKEEDTEGTRLKEKYATFEEFLASRDGNIRAAKDSSLAVFAAQLRSHASLNTLGKRWGYIRTEMFIKGLETIQDYDYDEKTGRYKPNGHKYFSKKDIVWLRKNSGTQVWRMLAKDSFIEVSPEFAGGIFESFGIFIKALVNSELKGTA